MKNETKQNEPQGLKQKLPTRNTRQQKESESLHPDARWWTSLINQADAWYDATPHRVAEKPIDPREFTGTAPPFSWE